ncbi:spermidine hydroxycinnamoyl transferase-like [Olea europaea subsp. europaea]|uniref:Spermidine hydroxycinnamoyl transferase-like n=1 Tax=Olea europaea subsp. europaea TaxID=158383 RepID=A0A8S0TBQ6_OLEEU|nr:spermidine hydroxycinnamoyl transferase-like [Olea europaea subsp. europaea]
MVTFKATHIVKPAEPTPEEILYLNACDQIKDITHTPTIYFYRNNDKLDNGDAIGVLKDSLSKVLVLFYPLAGRLKWSGEGGSRVELHCNSRGVPIHEAVSEATVEDFGDFTPTPEIQALIPSVDYTTPIDEIPLVIVQLTRFKCGGVSIGLGVSHVMADGPSALHFVDEWAKIARGAEPIIPPFLDRKVLETDKLLAEEFDPSALRPPPSLIGEEDNMEQRKKPITVAFLNLKKNQIEKLRNKASEDLNLENGNSRGYSRFEAVAAHIWRCTSKARRHVAEQPTSLHFVADFRNKLRPSLPKNFFGNALIRVEAADNSGNLLSTPIGSAARKIRAAVEKVTDETVRGYLDFLKGLPDVGRFRSLDNNGRPKGDFYGNPNLAIISWTALPLYGADFGWGKEIHMGPGSMGFDGKTFIIPSHDGDGSFNIAIWLQEENMGSFKKCFYDDI